MSNEFYKRVEQRQSLKALHSVQSFSDMQIVDNVSGLPFQKRSRTLNYNTEPRKVFASPEPPARRQVSQTERMRIDDANDRYDARVSSHLLSPESPETDLTSVKTVTTIATSKSTSAFKDLPAGQVKPHEYYRHIPTHLKKDTRLQQLLLWFAKSELKQDMYYTKEHDPVTESVKRKLIDKLSTSESMVSLLRRGGDRHEITDIVKSSAINEENKEKIKKIKSNIEDCEKELNAWQSCADKVFEFHAETMDRIAALKPEEYQIKYDLDFVSDIEPDQRKFVTEFLEAESEYKISDVIVDMNLDVTQLKQVLNTSNQFLIESTDWLQAFKRELAHTVTESTRIIPIDADTRILGLSENTEEKRRQDELRNAHKILRLFSRQKTKDVNTAITMDITD